MGGELNSEVLEAFAHTLEGMGKEAIKIPGLGQVAGLGRAAAHVGRFADGFLGNVRKAGTRLDPRTWGEAYRELAPRTGKMKEFLGYAKSKGQYLGKPTQSQFAEEAAQRANAPREGWGKILDKVIPSRVGREGAFMSENVMGKVPFNEIARGVGKAKGMSAPQRARMIAQEAGRRGWTGSGDITKYLPVGAKGLMVGFSASQIPGIVNAPKPTRTGEGGALELGLGELGGLGGMIAGTGVGIIPGMALWGLGQTAGSRVGRIADRMRAGASAGEAVNAPSPEEAQRQLNNIRQYYG